MLLIQRCPACGTDQFYHRPHCLTCGRLHPDPVAAQGTGTVYSYTILHRTQESQPPIVAVVELDEGPHMLTRLVGIPPDQVRIGMPVRVAFVPAEDPEGKPVPLPVFRPA